MRLPLLFSALAAATLIAGSAVAQDAPAAPVGVTVADARAWLTSVGGVVGEPEVSDGISTMAVADQLPWRFSLSDCQPACTDAQYTSAFTGRGVTLEWVNQWNREHRFLKAFYVAPASEGGEAGAIVQYDVLLTATGTDQLREPTGLWKAMQGQFVAALQAVTPDAASPAPAPAVQ